LGLVTRKFGLNNGSADVRFGSKADMCSATGHVRFTPKSDSKCGKWKPDFKKNVAGREDIPRRAGFASSSTSMPATKET
jgi:hypothetical protein